jgi:hypothetical protein
MVPLRTLVFSCATAGLTVAIALAQDANYMSVEATSDKPVQLSYHASAHQNCTPAPLPTIRVIEAPKSGTLTVRGAVLKTRWRAAQVSRLQLKWCSIWLTLAT